MLGVGGCVGFYGAAKVRWSSVSTLGAWYNAGLHGTEASWGRRESPRVEDGVKGIKHGRTWPPNPRPVDTRLVNNVRPGLTLRPRAAAEHSQYHSAHLSEALTHYRWRPSIEATPGALCFNHPETRCHLWLCRKQRQCTVRTQLRACNDSDWNWETVSIMKEDK